MFTCLHFVCGLFSNFKFYVMSAVLATLIGAGIGAFASHQATKDQNAYNQMLYDEYKDPTGEGKTGELIVLLIKSLPWKDVELIV